MTRGERKRTRRSWGRGTDADRFEVECGHGRRHVAQFYRSESVLASKVADFLAEGSVRGEALVVLASRDLGGDVADRLRERGVDTEAGARSGMLRMEEAGSVLERLLQQEGMPDAERFRTIVGGVLDEALRAADGKGVRVYGGMADQLVREGRIDAACALEDLWNATADTSPDLSLLCGYSIPSLDRPEHLESFERIAARHGLVLPDLAHPALREDPALAFEVALLQQRAQALEAEVRRREALEESLREALAHGRRSEEEGRRTHRELRAAKDEAERANRAKTRFLAVVSHELRTPLTAIIGYQDLLDMELKGPINAEQREFVRNIGAATQQALGLMEQLIELSRIEAGEEEVHVEAVDPAALVDEVMALVEPEARKKGLDIEARCHALPPSIGSDVVKLRQILLNLLGNAIKFTPEGRVALEARSDEGAIRFDVSDTGRGIAEGDRERIFEHFSRLPRNERDRGLGLGLALSRDLAALLGGTIGLESTPGEGSTFSLRVPAEAPTLASVPGSG